MALGFDEKGTGSVLVLIHGFPFDRTMWSAQLDALSDLRRVVAVDLPGRGKSKEFAGSSLDAYADEVVGTLDELGVAEADVAGLSMGGYVALSVLRRHSEKVRSLILLDTKPSADPEEAKPGREKAAEKAQSRGTIALEEDLFPKFFAAKTDESVKERVREMMRSTEGATGAQDALAMRDRADSTDALSKVEVPVLVLHGAEDILIPFDAAKEWASKVPGAKFVSIPDAGHLGPLENPDAVNSAIREFLS